MSSMRGTLQAGLRHSLKTETFSRCLKKGADEERIFVYDSSSELGAGCPARFVQREEKHNGTAFKGKATVRADSGTSK